MSTPQQAAAAAAEAEEESTFLRDVDVEETAYVARCYKADFDMAQRMSRHRAAVGLRRECCVCCELFENAHQGSGMLIVELPAEILVHVFGFVGRLTLMISVPVVCREWQRVCLELMPPVDLNFAWATQTRRPGGDVGLEGLLRRFRAVRSLTLERCDGVTDAGLATIGEGCPELESLDLSSCNGFTDAGLATIGAGCPNLESLGLRWCKITDAGLATIGAGCPNLKRLGLDDCDGVTDAGLSLIGAGCPNLKSLDLHSCKQITDAGLATIGAACPELESLDLNGCHMITEAGLAKSHQDHPKLRCRWTSPEDAAQSSQQPWEPPPQ